MPHIILIKSYTDKPWRSPETFHLIEQALRKRWDVEPIEAESLQQLDGFISAMKKRHGDDLFIFNISEYIDERTMQGFLPAYLEKSGIRYLGSGAMAVSTGLAKTETKKVLARNNVPTPNFLLIPKGDDEITLQDTALRYPLFVKPDGTGGHIGIDNDSIVKNEAELRRAVKRVHEAFRQNALVEEFITGESMREFSVGILDGTERIFLPVEIDYSSMNAPVRILSHDLAMQDEEKVIPVTDGKLFARLADLAERTFDALGAHDYSRVDIRMNEQDCYVLEINVMPGIGPASFLPEAAKFYLDMKYEDLVRKLVEVSLERQTSAAI